MAKPPLGGFVMPTVLFVSKALSNVKALFAFKIYSTVEDLFSGSSNQGVLRISSPPSKTYSLAKASTAKATPFAIEERGDPPIGKRQAPPILALIALAPVSRTDYSRTVSFHVCA